MAEQASVFTGRVGRRGTGRPAVFRSRVCRDLELNGSLSTAPWDRNCEDQQGPLVMSSLRRVCEPLVPLLQTLLEHLLQRRPH